jgi:hypothetical protein
MTHQGYRAKEARNAVTGGVEKSIFITGGDEVAHHSRNDEEIPGAMHSTTTDHCPLG